LLNNSQQSINEAIIHSADSELSKIIICSTGEEIYLSSIIKKYEKKVKNVINQELDFIFLEILKHNKFLKCFQLCPDFNFLWVGSLFENSALKTPSLYTYIKAYAVYLYLVDKKISTVSFSIDDRIFQSHLTKILHSNNILIKYMNKNKYFLDNKYMKPLMFLSYPIKGILTLVKYIWKRRHWFFKKSDIKNLQLTNSYIYFSYSSLFDNHNLENKGFSSFWPNHHHVATLDSASIYFNWYTGSSPKSSLDELSREYNAISSDKKKFLLIDTLINARVLFNVLKGYLLAIVGTIFFYPSSLKTSLKEKKFHMLETLEHEFLESIFGKYAVIYLFEFYLFSELFLAMSNENRSEPLAALHHCENQSWEKSLNFLWRKNYNKQIVGVINNAFSILDLRHSFDGEGAYLKNQSDLFFPMIFASQEKDQTKNYESIFGPNKVRKIESKRYNYLLNKSYQPLKKLDTDSFKILIFGDYLQSINMKLVNTVTSALKMVSLEPQIFFKSHPSNYDIKVRKKFNLYDHGVIHPGSSLQDYDIVISSLSSGASIDINFLHPNAIALSSENFPNIDSLYSSKNIKISHSAEDLAGLMKNSFSSNLIYNTGNYKNPSELFYLDDNFSKWKMLFKEL
jgi:surface carbohydrate biosynthesis protein (TIGR04326 family)